MKQDYKLYEVKTEKSKLHSIEAHNYWAERKIPCPYCLNGSKPVPKALVTASDDEILKIAKEVGLKIGYVKVRK